MFEIERARITAERHPKKIPSFEQWQRTQRLTIKHATKSASSLVLKGWGF